jgi:arylformamidase
MKRESEYENQSSQSEVNSRDKTPINHYINLEKLPVHCKIIDITTPISPFTKVFPGDPKPAIDRICTLEKEGCAVSRLILGSHTGTHVDAPAHVLDYGLPVDKLELEKLMGKALILDFSSLEGALTADILEKVFKNTKISDRISDNISILLLKTESPFRKQKSGDDVSFHNEGFEKEEMNPLYLDESAALWIVEKKFKTIGIDGFSVDSFHSETLPAHHILLSGNVNVVECLELSSVDSGIYFFLCLPLKIEGCDGAPARALLISYS